MTGRRPARGSGRPAGPRRGAGGRRAGAAPGADPLEDLRRRIDAIDRRLVGLLNARAGLAIRLGRIKKARGIAIYQPAREEEVLRNVRGTNGGPLEDGALKRLFERIIDESRSIERVTMAGEEERPSSGRGPAPDGRPGD
ncbi:MAG: chorismate mutase [Acidobacteriota bacterium]